MLDSGEADTWRHSNGRWDFNDGRLATGSEKRPYMRGVFHRSIDGGKTMTGFFINTNKTADINKDEKEKGYVRYPGNWTNCSTCLRSSATGRASTTRLNSRSSGHRWRQSTISTFLTETT